MTVAINNEPVVYLVDDDAAVRSGFSALFRSVGLPVTSFASGEAFLEAVDEHSLGCLVVDVRMPGMSGLELQERLRDRGVGLPIILISAHGDVPMAVRAMKAGAIDFLEKPVNEQVLLDRVQGCLRVAHRTYDDAELVAATRARLEALTPREREVLDRLVKGESSKIIAAELDISPRTVDVHRAHIMDKLGVRSIAELVRVALMVKEH
jgi:two-component system response regulator FixJ